MCLAANVAVAQDPTKVEPRHYKLHFENDRVQVVDVHYGPHEKSEMHEHPAGVSVALSDGHLRFTDPNGKVTEVYAKRGDARWFPPHKHEVENLGDESYNAVYVGIKGKLTHGCGRSQAEFSSKRRGAGEDPGGLCSVDRETLNRLSASALR